MEPTTQHRSSIRRILLAQRFAMTAKDRHAQQTKLVEQLSALIAARPPNHITALFMPHAGEPDVLDAVKLLAQNNLCQFALPVVVSKGQPLRFARWSLGDELETDIYGIREPKHKQWVTPDSIVAPCVGISTHDGKTYRLGYGGGYYDRTVAQLREQRRDITLIGIAWANTQCLLSPQGHDVALDHVLQA